MLLDERLLGMANTSALIGTSAEQRFAFALHSKSLRESPKEYLNKPLRSPHVRRG